MFGKIMSKKEKIKEHDVMEIANELSTQEYSIRFDRNYIGVIRLVSGKWIFMPDVFCIHEFTLEEIAEIYIRLKELNFALLA